MTWGSEAPRRLGPLVVSACLRPLVVSACLRPALPCLVRTPPRSAMWLCTDQSCPPVTNVARNSPPHISDFEIRPLELQRLWAISKNDRVKLRATFAGTVTAVTLGPLYRPREPRPRLATTNSFTKNRRNHHENLQSAAHPRPHGPLAVSLAAVCVSGLPCDYVLISHARQSPMSHVIPLHIFQTLKSDRWNCNVCGPSQKMTELNYVRLLLGRLPPSLSVLSTDHANRDQDWLQRTPSPRTVATITRT